MGKNGWKLSKMVKKWLKIVKNVYKHMFLELKSPFFPKFSAPSAPKIVGLRAVGAPPPILVETPLQHLCQRYKVKDEKINIAS